MTLTHTKFESLNRGFLDAHWWSRDDRAQTYKNLVCTCDDLYYREAP